MARAWFSWECDCPDCERLNVAELVLGWDGINPEKPGVAESKLVCIYPELEGPGCGCSNLEGPGMAKLPSAWNCPELEGPGTTGPVDFYFCLLEAPLAGGFLFLLGDFILSDVLDFFWFEDDWNYWKKIWSCLSNFLDNVGKRKWRVKR
jgi:hypothetical protein